MSELVGLIPRHREKKVLKSGIVSHRSAAQNNDARVLVFNNLARLIIEHVPSIAATNKLGGVRPLRFGLRSHIDWRS